MTWIFNLLVFIGTFILMECFAWWMHKYILHGPLWFVHKSHHRPHKGWFEINDLVVFVYAIPAIATMVYGEGIHHWTWWIGAGISAYGIFYFILHDIIIHRRIKVKYHFQNSYIKRLIRAHKIHHKHLQKEDSKAFGFLYAIKKYEVKTSRKSSENKTQTKKTSEV
ncbi:MAG: sterol desaturase family protein [Chitinophagales bacterium]